MLCLLLALLEQAGGHLSGLPHHLFSDRDQLLIEGSLLCCLLFLLFFPDLCSSYKSMELLRNLPSTAQSLPTGFFYPSHLPFYQGFGSLDEAGKHSHAIDQKAAISRMMDAGLHTGAIQTQFPSLDHLRLRGELNDAIIQPMHGFGTDKLCPTDQGGIVGNVFKVDPTEPAQH